LEEEDTNREATFSTLNLQPNGEEEEDDLVHLRVRANLNFTFH